MRAFHNDKNIKTKYYSRVLAHQKADNIVQGTGWSQGKGCAVGCTLENYNHVQYEVELGIPEWLALLEDQLFEGMDKKDALLWPAKFLKAINVGSDLNKIKIPYTIYLLKENLKTLSSLKVDAEFTDVIAAIKLTKDATKQMITTLKNNDESAESAAWSAARSAARSARSAESAARSAAYKKHADKLLKMIKECK